MKGTHELIILATYGRSTLCVDLLLVRYKIATTGTLLTNFEYGFEQTTVYEPYLERRLYNRKWWSWWQRIFELLIKWGFSKSCIRVSARLNVYPKVLRRRVTVLKETVGPISSLLSALAIDLAVGHSLKIIIHQTFIKGIATLK